MSQHRAPSPPPLIPGFEYVQLLGSGGFADVFLFQQNLPRRRVAVKVLLADAVGDGGVEAFTTEANLMAQLSTHPAIVSIYEAGVAPDGRPYLVMEYCSKPNLQSRYRRQRLSVAEALRIGIQVAGAVETAHRAGILHRDIKPANILVTEYGRPALTDFGIAGTAAAAQEAAGMSIPWSPPESFDATASSSSRTDIYALGATVYTLLAGRSPFEKPGGKNGATDLIDRIQREALPPVDRADVPDSLYRVLATSMAKLPDHRYRTALEFAWALQKVQIELAMSVTSVDVIDDSVDEEAHDEEDDGRTRVRSVVSINPDGDTTPPLDELPFATSDATVLRDLHVAGAPTEVDGATMGRKPVGPASDAIDRTVMRGADVRFESSAAGIELTQARVLPAAEPVAPEPPAKRGTLGLILGVVGAVAAVGVVAVILAQGGGDPGNQATQEPTTSAKPVDDVVVPRQVPQVTDLTGVAGDGVVVFTWTNPEPQAGDAYLWGVIVGEAAPTLEPTEELTVTVPYDGTEVCIEVLLRRADGRSGATSATGCAP